MGTEKRRRLGLIKHIAANDARHRLKRRTMHAWVEDGKYEALKQYARRHHTSLTEIITQMLDSIQQLDE